MPLIGGGRARECNSVDGRAMMISRSLQPTDYGANGRRDVMEWRSALSGVRKLLLMFLVWFARRCEETFLWFGIILKSLFDLLFLNYSASLCLAMRRISVLWMQFDMLAWTWKDKVVINRISLYSPSRAKPGSNNVSGIYVLCCVNYKIRLS